MATHSSILAWKVPWTKEAGGLQSKRFQKESDTTQRLNNNHCYVARLFASLFPDFSEGYKGCSIASLWLVTKLILQRLHDRPQFSPFSSVAQLCPTLCYAVHRGENLDLILCYVINILWWSFFFPRTKTNKQWLLGRVWKEGKPPNWWWECELVQPLRRIVWRFLKKLKTELSCDPAIPLLGMYLERNLIPENTLT